MSAGGYCYDNAFAESAFASVKAELPDAEMPFPSKQAARLSIFDYIETFYNRRCRPTSLGSISPFDYLKINFTTHNKNLNQFALDLSTFSGDFHSFSGKPLGERALSWLAERVYRLGLSVLALYLLKKLSG